MGQYIYGVNIWSKGCCGRCCPGWYSHTRVRGTQAGDRQSFPIAIQPLWVALEMQLTTVPPRSFTGTRSKPPGHTKPAAAELHVAWGHIQDMQASHPWPKPTLLRLLLTPL